MTKLSRIPLNKEVMENLIGRFWQTLAALRTKREVELFLAGFLSHTEVKMFAKRLQIARMLLRKTPYADIRKVLKVTDAPITRLSNILHDNEPLRAFVEKFSG